jgi:tRNA(Ile)-lysidine synthase
MASSRKSPKSNALLAHVTAILGQHVKRGDRLVAGLSGGVDSVVLLELLQRLSKSLRFELAALHVNHQINPSSGRFAAFCRAFCKSRAVPLTVVRVTVPRGNSLEAAARAARYQAFATLPADFIALAHNLDDQAETVFLQLLRGAGVKGLSAMPIVSDKKAALHAARLTPSILRPLLEIPRRQIEAYARSHELEWIEDDSNADTAFDRNFLRHRVLPVVAQRYPSYRKTLLRTSRNFAEAAQLLDELAAADAQLTVHGLKIGALRASSAARAKNVVRHFLALHGVLMPNAARLDECVRQVLHAQRAKRLAIDLDGHTLRRFADELRVVPKSGALARDFMRRWNGESKLRLPELGGTLVLKKSRGAGISLAKLSAQPVIVRVRQGGERFRPHPQRPRRSLKNLLQEARVPPWLRDRLPFLFVGTMLVYVPRIGVDSAFQAAAGELGVEPEWVAD